jgi:hypothetical protein
LDDHVILIENKIATKFFIGILWYTKYFFNIFYYASLKSLGNTNLDRQRDKIISRQNMTYTVKKLDRQTDRQTDRQKKQKAEHTCVSKDWWQSDNSSCRVRKDSKIPELNSAIK